MRGIKEKIKRAVDLSRFGGNVIPIIMENHIESDM